MGYQGTKIMSGTTVLAAKGGATLQAIFSSNVAGTPGITVYDAATAVGTPLVAKFVPVAATKYDFGGLGCGAGLTVVVSASCNCTVIWQPASA